MVFCAQRNFHAHPPCFACCAPAVCAAEVEPPEPLPVWRVPEVQPLRNKGALLQVGQRRAGGVVMLVCALWFRLAGGRAGGRAGSPLLSCVPEGVISLLHVAGLFTCMHYPCRLCITLTATTPTVAHKHTRCPT